MTTKGKSKSRRRRPAESPATTTDKPKRKSRPKSGGRGPASGGSSDGERRDGGGQGGSGGRDGGRGGSGSGGGRGGSGSGGSGGGRGRGGSGGSGGRGGRSGGRSGRGPARSGPRGGGPNGGNNYGGGRTEETSVRSSRARVVPFEDLFTEAGKGALKIGLALRELIREVLPDAEERIHLAWKIVLYSEPSEVCGIQIVSKHCNLYFSNGANMEDPDGLLEGSGKAIRHVKVRTLDDLPVEQLKELIREAKRAVRRPIQDD